MKRFLALLLICALAFTMVACATETEEPKKERKRSTAVDAAIFTIYVNYSLGYSEISSSDLEEGRPTLETIRDIITSNYCLDEVASIARESGATPPQISELREMIYVTAAENSDVIQIGVAAGDEELSKTLASALCDVVPKVINEIIAGSATKIVSKPYIGTLNVE